MGGCRCTFWQCENNSATRPEVHFFRYPVNDPERLKVWVANADREDLLTLPKDKLTNKVVCQLHFERKMFMNDLRARITKLAIPRLVQMKNGQMFNVETKETVADDDRHSTENLEPMEESNVTLPTLKRVSTLSMASNSDEEEPAQSAIKKIKILNSEPRILSKIDKPSEIIRIRAMERPRKQPIVLKKVQSPMRRSIDIAPVPTKRPVEQNETITIENVTEESLEPAIDESPLSPAAAFSLPNVTNGDDSLVANPVPHVVDPALVEQLDRNNQEIADLKLLVQELLNRPVAEHTTVQMVSSAMKMERGPLLTKAQLFNGIKRYLNPSMVTLLRMELFAGPTNRPWKTDEKALAVDLLTIGEKVYDHFVDEFRFRLPPKTDARSWQDSGEIDADDAC